MGQRKKLPEAGVPEWMVSYGDMMGLLLCFFIMLFALSTLDVPKFDSAAESISNALGSPTKSRAKGSPAGRPKRTVQGGGVPTASALGMEQSVQNIRQDEQPVSGGLIQFELNSADLNDMAKANLDILYDELNGSPFIIMIKGHSSTSEMAGGSTRDTDLSYNRALAVREYLVIEKEMPPDIFQVHAVGPHQPLGRQRLSLAVAPQEADAVVEVVLIGNLQREVKGSKADQRNKYINDTP